MNRNDRIFIDASFIGVFHYWKYYHMRRTVQFYIDRGDHIQELPSVYSLQELIDFGFILEISQSDLNKAILIGNLKFLNKR